MQLEFDVLVQSVSICIGDMKVACLNVCLCGPSQIPYYCSAFLRETVGSGGLGWGRGQLAVGMCMRIGLENNFDFVINYIENEMFIQIYYSGR